MYPLVGLSSPVMGSGKTTIANHLVAEYGFRRVRFAGPLKAMTRTLLEQAGLAGIDGAIDEMIDGELKELPIPALGGKSPRQLMQTLGTEWGRVHVSQNVWLNLTMTEVERLRRLHPVVIDDMRFLNEAVAIQEAGGLLARIVRPNVKIGPTGHASEGGLDGFPHDLVVFNDSTLDAIPELAAGVVSRAYRQTTREVAQEVARAIG